jgi:type I restriction enzyme S subunit
MRQLPPGWIMSTVGQVGEVSLGRQRAPKYHHGDGMRPYLRVANVFEDRIDTTDVMQMTFSDDEFERYRLQSGDVLLNEGQSPHLLGRPAIYRGHPPDVAFTNSLIRFRAGPGVTPEWALTVFRHYMRSRRFMRESRITTNIAHLSAKRFSTVEFPVPPEAEQRRIVAAVDEQFSRFDTGVAALERARQNLKRMRSAVLQAAVNGVIVNASAEKWTNATLGELLEDMHAGKSFKCAERPAEPDEWGVVKVSAMTWGEFRESENKTVEGDRNIDPRFEIHPGDLLVSRANTVDYVGAVVLVRDCRQRLLLSDKSLRLVPTSHVMPEWLVISLRASSARRYIESVATGTSDSMRNISQPKLRALSIKLPPLEVQAELVSEVGRMMSLIEQLERSLADNYRSMHALRASILGAAFSGRLAAQDTNDEPASALLTRIAVEHASFNGQKFTRTGKPRTPREKVVV